VEDALSMPSAKGGQILIQPLVFNRVMDILPVSGWQVIQETESSLKVLLSGARDGILDQAVSDAIRKELASEGAGIPQIKVQHLAEIPKNASGKAPLIKSNLHQDRKIV
jgi:phenylacetate-CoA ligase